MAAQISTSTRRVLSDLNVNSTLSKSSAPELFINHKQASNTTSIKKQAMEGQVAHTPSLPSVSLAAGSEVFKASGLGGKKRDRVHGDYSVQDGTAREGQKRQRQGTSTCGDKLYERRHISQDKGEVLVPAGVEGKLLHVGTILESGRLGEVCDNVSTVTKARLLLSPSGSPSCSPSSQEASLSPEAVSFSVTGNQNNESQDTVTTIPDDAPIVASDNGPTISSQSFSNSRSLSRQDIRKKAQAMRLRLSLASYKVKTNQIDLPLARLEFRPNFTRRRDTASTITSPNKPIARTPLPTGRRSSQLTPTTPAAQSSSSIRVPTPKATGSQTPYIHTAQPAAGRRHSSVLESTSNTASSSKSQFQSQSSLHAHPEEENKENREYIPSPARSESAIHGYSSVYANARSQKERETCWGGENIAKGRAADGLLRLRGER